MLCKNSCFWNFNEIMTPKFRTRYQLWKVQNLRRQARKVSENLNGISFCHSWGSDLAMLGPMSAFISHAKIWQLGSSTYKHELVGLVQTEAPSLNILFRLTIH